MNRTVSNNDNEIEKLKSFQSKTLNCPALVEAIKRKRDAIELYEFVSLNAPNDFIKHEARKNCLVTLASSLEVFFKEIVMDFRDKWSPNSFSDLLKEKISLNDAFTLFKEVEIRGKRSLLTIIHFKKTISFVFDKLSGKNFLSEVGQFGALQISILPIRSGVNNTAPPQSFERNTKTIFICEICLKTLQQRGKTDLRSGIKKLFERQHESHCLYKIWNTR